MARRSSTSSPSALPRSAQRSLKALTKGTPRSGTRIAGEAARAAAKRLNADIVVSASNAGSTAVLWAMATAANPGEQRKLKRAKRHAMRVTDYKRRGRTLVSLCEVEGLGHAWSGGAPRLPFSDAAGPSATRLVWAFVSKQFAAHKLA